MFFRVLGAGAMVLALAFAGGVRAQTPDLSSLHDALHLTAAQEDGWRAYRAAIAPDPSAQARRRAAAMMMATLPTPRRIDLVNAEMSEDLAEAHRQGEAVKAFYASLTPDQQRTFDHETLQSNGAGGGGSRQTGSGQPLRQPPSTALRQPGQP
jgi:hypothetical protein